MPQLWQGRSSKAVDSRVNDFNSSIRFDARMIEQDIHGSMVHSAMLGKQGIISQQDVDDIHKGLQSILNDLHSGALEIDPNAEDVHTFVEQTLTARVGDAGKRLHTGRSRNDQVALDIRLNLREASLHLAACRMPPPAWTLSARWVPALWLAPPTRWTVFIRHRSWALLLPAGTRSMAYLTAISALS